MPLQKGLAGNTLRRIAMKSFDNHSVSCSSNTCSIIFSHSVFTISLIGGLLDGFVYRQFLKINLNKIEF